MRISILLQLLNFAGDSFYKEIYVKGCLGPGFIDLFDPINFEYYEVKRSTVPASQYSDQMNKYNFATIVRTRGNKRKLGEIDAYVGRRVFPGRDRSISGEFQYGAYTVSYYWARNGLIQYTTEKTRQSQEAQIDDRLLLAGTVILVVAAIICTAGNPAVAGGSAILISSII